MLVTLFDFPNETKHHNTLHKIPIYLVKGKLTISRLNDVVEPFKFAMRIRPLCELLFLARPISGKMSGQQVLAF